MLKKLKKKKKKAKVVDLKILRVLAAWNIFSVSILQVIRSGLDNRGDMVGAFPVWAEFANIKILSVLDDLL